MSRAFVRESDGLDELPEKLISSHRNLVTPEGLASIEAEVQRLQNDLAEAQQKGDRDIIQRASRDLRYWSQRLGTAEVQPPPAQGGVIAFGSTVTIARRDGRVQAFRLVGEEEANPAKGTISYVSPLAQALMGKVVGDTVAYAAIEAEVVAIR